MVKVWFFELSKNLPPPWGGNAKKYFKVTFRDHPTKKSTRQDFSLQLPPQTETKKYLSQLPFFGPKISKKKVLTVFCNFFTRFFLIFFAQSVAALVVFVKVFGWFFCDQKLGLKTDLFYCHVLMGPSKKINNN